MKNILGCIKASTTALAPIFLLGLGAEAAPKTGVAAAYAPLPSSRSVQHGLASWYQSGRRTASGEAFDPNAMTAAHRTLPFGTRLRVVHVQSGRDR